MARAPRRLVYRPVSVRPAQREARVAGRRRRSGGRREIVEPRLGPWPCGESIELRGLAGGGGGGEGGKEPRRGVFVLWEGKRETCTAQGPVLRGGETRRFGAARGPHKRRAHGAPDARGAGPATTPHPAAYPARAWEELSSKRGARLSSGGARGERRRRASLGRVGCVMEMWSASRRAARLWASRGGDGLLTARGRFGTAQLAAAALCAAKGRFAGRAANADGRPSALHTPVHLRGMETCAVSGRRCSFPPHGRPPRRGCRAIGGR
ncbi:hypothetical protein B0H13DRAFT_1065081 [Mycena leptocephala]|nr:hypothetical protein B0H13DRAFT_1065081 [Mycena leptocephala]